MEEFKGEKSFVIDKLAEKTKHLASTFVPGGEETQLHQRRSFSY